MSDRTALLGPDAGGESKNPENYGSAAAPFPWIDPAMLRMGSGEARAQGDLSENAEYDAAKEAQLIRNENSRFRRKIIIC